MLFVCGRAIKAMSVIIANKSLIIYPANEIEREVILDFRSMEALTKCNPIGGLFGDCYHLIENSFDAMTF